MNGRKSLSILFMISGEHYKLTNNKMDTLRQTTPKARKEHICDFCNKKKKKGEKYNYSIHVGDYIYGWKSHIKCSDIVNELDMYKDCDDGVTDSDFNEYIREEFISLQTEDNFEYPDFQGQLDFVINYYDNLNKQ